MSLINTLTGPVLGILDKFVEDKDAKARMAHEIATIADKQAHEVALQQIELNKIEAKGSWIQRSWRPLIGLTCAVAFMWHFVLHPVALFVIAVAGLKTPELVTFDMNSLLTVLGGLLGLGSLRTFEKYKGVSK